jgi:hypothetical protein
LEVNVAVLLVGYDLNSPGQHYEALWEKLRSYGTWWRHLDSTWLIKANLTPRQLHDQLAPLLDVNDELFIVDITGRAWWSRGLSERALNWIHSNLPG